LASAPALRHSPDCIDDDRLFVVFPTVNKIKQENVAFDLWDFGDKEL
jgi:hypothetical protein